MSLTEADKIAQCKEEFIAELRQTIRHLRVPSHMAMSTSYTPSPTGYEAAVNLANIEENAADTTGDISQVQDTILPTPEQPNVENPSAFSTLISNPFYQGF